MQVDAARVFQYPLHRIQPLRHIQQVGGQADFAASALQPLRESRDGRQRARVGVLRQRAQLLVIVRLPAPGVFESLDWLQAAVAAFERQVVGAVGIERRVEVNQVDGFIGQFLGVIQYIEAVGGVKLAIHLRHLA